MAAHSRSLTPNLDQKSFLQLSVEKETSTLEKERRYGDYLNELIHKSHTELRSKSVLPPVKISAKHVGIVTKELESRRKLLNFDIEKNRQLREEINSYRLDYMHCKKSCDEYSSLLNKYRNNAKHKMRSISINMHSSSSHRNKIIALQRRREDYTNRYSAQITQLNSFIKEDRKSRQLLGSVAPVTKSITYPSHINTLLMNLNDKWAEKVKDKKKDLEKYIAEVKNLELAFEEIQTATGVNELQEIVSGLIKAEDQKYDVVSYINGLNSNIEALENSLQQSKNRIENWNSMQRKINHSANSISDNLQSKFDSQMKKLRKVKEKDEAICEQLAQVQEIVSKAEVYMKKFNIQSEKGLDVYETLPLVLQNIENMVNVLLVYGAQAENEDQPFISAISKQIRHSTTGDQQTRALDLIETDELYKDSDIEMTTEVLDVSQFRAKANTLIT